MTQGKQHEPVDPGPQSGSGKITDQIDFDQIEALDSSGHRRLSGWLARLVAVWAIFAAGFHLVVLVFHPIDPWLFRNYHLVLLGVLGFILIPGWSKAKERVHWLDWVFVVLLLVCGWYIVHHFQALLWRAGVVPTKMDFYVALIGVLLVLELVRRASGWALPILCSVFIAYAFLGPYLPGMLQHRGYSMERFFTYIYSLDGVFSVPLAISSKYIILFIIFGAFLQVSGVGRYFVKWAFSVSGHARGGPAKVAVIASALMGTMNGTSAGNAVATGSFTIPLMRKVGYSPRFAAATEAVASTGGQIMPPVMGAGIFIMAELTGIPFQHLIIAGIIPALLYFISVYFMVDLEAIKLKLVGFPRHMLPSFRSVMRQGYLFLPVLILFVMLLMGRSVVMAGFWAIVSSLLVSWFSRSTAMGPSKVLKALETGAKNAVQLMAVCAGAGIIMGVIALTGVGMKFASVILGIADTNQFLALVFAMGISIVLGMGLPTTAAYAVAASVVAPGLIQLGITPLVAHFFIFYFACVSAITPPVALAAYAASGISGSDPMKTSVTSFRLGIAAYIVPFMFFYAPEILTHDNLLKLILHSFTALIGIIALSCAAQRFYFGRLNVPLAVVMFVTAVSLVSPNLYLGGAGLAVLAGLFFYQRYYRRRNDQAPGAPAVAG
ncbi:TRAP transporter permease [Candidatus Desulforudis audaxviator]|uniref:TRAP transporter, 4TM/12TM fusion protein n=1 Tax=Desulforudis audaxviator (strain MP104C) TaxID=477974 RepID=B1I427_DESAP|nr:TRAP transporter permease [Candidatus Desulforudis audaxviator]ACA59766.1 TRAP transporter, 4TM/12TM fusion protein [Candidatus Desulforudis audaxviator MP104C]AZK59765.1 TRAP-type uncharacterized transport system, fused permease component [Candidatus Desulforudis audaxviator]